MFRRRQARYGTLAATSVLIVLGILVAVNYIGKQQNKRWDLTENKQFSLSDQSRNVVAKLDAPVEIMGFMPPADQPVDGQHVPRSAAGVRRPLEPDQAGADRRRPQPVGRRAERGARLRRDRHPPQGPDRARHRRRRNRTSPTRSSRWSAARRAPSTSRRATARRTRRRTKSAATWRRRSRSSARTTPSRSSCWRSRAACPTPRRWSSSPGPRVDFLPGEIETLEKYLAKAGKLLLELDAPGPDESPLPNLTGLAKKWGIDVGNNLVLDQTGMGQLFGGAAETPVAANYPSHPITSRLDVMTAFRMARSVTPVSGGNEGHTAQSHRRNQPAQLGRGRPEVALRAASRRRRTKGAGDKAGPISIAAAVSAPVGEAKPAAPEGEGAAPKPETRVVVFGDSDFASNMLFTAGGNRDLFMNTRRLALAAGEPDLDPAEGTERSPADDERGAAEHVTWFSLLIVPLAIFGTGRLQLVAEAVMRGLRSTIALLAVLVGLGAYIYFVTWKQDGNTAASSEKKVFQSVESGDIAGIDDQGRKRRPHDRQEGRRTLADRRADPGGRRRIRRHRGGFRAGQPRRRAGRRRGPGRSRAVRPGVAARRGRVQGQRRKAVRQAAARREDADRQQRLRDEERREARVSRRRATRTPRSTSRPSTCATSR